ncbi:hydroxymethylbilane synthase [Helicobacter magdeburgensis]|uniref:Porphobilinogen deaminase n=1 Tax=Helicobacter magdeburgensis TaxID=471858 RepID=A0A4U8T3C5_9HELI|nr:hydroxymethylbilane synthase [Helicobacter magdeburgensis]TLD93864.1 hydroxymethylbilane synthase [Helicobacter magdeburgensis]
MQNVADRKLIIGTRGSALALWQAQYVKNCLKDECGLDSELKIIKTQGDKILDVPLAKIGGKGLFTKELEQKLLNKEIDLAVHSLKDVPVEILPLLDLAAITEREDCRDCFLSMKYESLESLPQGARVGTTSLRRSMQIKAFRADLDTLSLRGNIQTRLEKLKNGVFDAIILAQAGVKRLGIDVENNDMGICHIVPLDFMIPAMGQGALGIEMRKDSPYFETISRLTHKRSVLCVSAERSFVRELEGGCQVPIGVQAVYENGILRLRAMVGLPSGQEILQESLEDSMLEEDKAKAESLGKYLAQSFIAKGAKEILSRARDMAFA